VAIRFFRPWEVLRDVIVRIYGHESDASPFANRRWLIAPDGDVKIIFPFRGEITCTIGEASRLHGTSRLIVSGMRTVPGYLEFSEGLGAIGVIVRPEAAYRLFPVPQTEIANRTVDGEEIFGPVARRWHGELMSLSRLEDRVERIQALLWDWLNRHENRRDLIVEYAVRRLKRASGGIPIEVLTRRAGWSRRQLER
jgi:uncharacterized protein DUF6597